MMRLTRIFATCLFAIIFTACSPNHDQNTTDTQNDNQKALHYEINVKEIAGKHPAAVAGLLGDPSSEEIIKSEGRSLPKKYYDNGDIEIVYVNGVADWITIYGHGRLPYDASAISQLGLANLTPTFANQNAVIKWTNQPGFTEVSLFPGQGNYAFYAYILVNTSP